MRITSQMGKLTRPWLLGLSLLMITTAQADETEIFFQNDASKVNANVLFLLDASGSMGVELSGSGGKSRMQVMQETFRDVMSIAPSNVNIGLMHYANANFIPSYGWDSVKGVNFPVSPVNANATEIVGAAASSDNLIDPAPGGMPVRAFLADIVDSWHESGYTPIVDSLYEAALYYRGESPVWGKYGSNYAWAAHPSTYSGSLTCDSSVLEQCGKTWGECNGTEDPSTCTDQQAPTCCNWVDDDTGGYCVNNDFSCSTTLTFCQHTICNAYSGTPVYKSPIEQTCQANYLVLMSDGKPEYPYWLDVTADGTGRYPESVAPDQSYDNNLVPDIFPDPTSSQISPTVLSLIGGGNCIDAPQGYKSGKCGPELTRFLADQDQSPLDGVQTVKTFTVAFGMGDEPNGTAYLASLATAENGAYTANNKEELVAAFKGVLGEAGKASYSFSSPSFSVDQSSLLANENSVYVPVFDASRLPVWSGNLRKFDVNAEGTIVDANGNSALTDTGTLEDQAQDLWSTAPHGSDVAQGGAASQLPAPGDRNLWTDVGTAGALLPIDPATSQITAAMLTSGTYTTQNSLLDFIGGSGFGTDGISCWGKYTDCDGVVHTVMGNIFTGANCVNIAEVTTCPANPISDDYRTTLLNFVRGYEGGVADAGTPARQHMGDMLNSKPVVISFDSGVKRVFVGTNEGYLHAIDAETGVEKWAFMPKSLLTNIDTFYRNEDANQHVYGIDGAVTVWRIDHNHNGKIETTVTEDQNGDGQINSDDEDRVYLFFGLRRGGRVYYGLDVTFPDSPQLLWSITPDTVGFAGLGETWSKPTLSKMRFGSDQQNAGLTEMRTVLVFGGGYDSNKDVESINTRLPDSLGKDIFIVDAKTGELLWSLQKGYRHGGSTAQISGASSLQHSIPGDIRILDMDGNGALDRLYFSDTGGNVWRVDMDMDVGDGGDTYYDYSKARLIHLASLGGGSSSLDHRKFFYEPDTAMRLHNGQPIMTIAIGSGYRTHPLAMGAEPDRFYVLLDKDVYSHPASDTAAIGNSDLLDVATLSAGQTLLDYPDKKGWYYGLPHNGEKVMAPALTFLDKVLFTTFALADEQGNASIPAACDPAVTTSRAYVLDVLTGGAVVDLSNAPDGSKDRFAVVGTNELLDVPQLIFGGLRNAAGGDCTLGDCQQDLQVRIGKTKLPLLSMENTVNTQTAEYNEMIDVTKLLPRLYWLDEDVSK